MKVVFFGGGSFRTLPIIRCALRDAAALADAEIVLLDLNLGRAEAVGKLCAASPEFRAANCRISWTDSMDVALPGADMVSVSMAVGSPEVCAFSTQACQRHGFIGSDQLSLSGSFRALTGGRIILGLARKMEKHCPNALLVDFANPVAVYSGMVNNHTKISALGVCGGFANHRYDLTRILGYEGYRDGYDVVSAGVNHCSCLLRGTYQGRDIHDLLAERFADPNWAPPAETPAVTAHALYQMRDLFRLHGHILFSLEGDGLDHVFPRDFPVDPRSEAVIRADAQAARAKRATWDAEFAALAKRADEADFWQTEGTTNHWLTPPITDLTAVLMHAVAGSKPMTFAGSRTNNGAVRGITDRTVLEYTLTLDRGKLTPAEDLEIPAGLHGLMSSLAVHQTLVGDAIATEDPRILAQAMRAYPARPFHAEVDACCKELLVIHRDEIVPAFQAAAQYF